MAVTVIVSNPPALLEAIRKAAKNGTLETWSVDSDGDFTHSPEQWRFKAWLRPKVGTDRITFYILTPKNKTMTKTVYAVYHGRFIEMLLTHFDNQFASAVATALPIVGDRVGGSSV